MTASGLSLIFDGKEQEKENLRGEKYVYNQFESTEDCTCVNREFFLFGSGQKSFRMYILHTLISFMKILPVLSQKYVISLL